MSYDTDILILGGGCAGLSLAAALREQHCKLRVNILEARNHYTRDRTWCLWNTEPHPFQACSTHRWNAWSVSNRSRSVTRSSRRYAYEHIPADRFYDAAIEGVDSTDTQQLCRGVSVTSASTTHQGYRVETTAGTLLARYLFDSRPLQTTLARGAWTQRFTGWHVRTEAPVFDDTTVELMSFHPSPVAGRILFFYVLPFARDEAMVEATCLDTPGLGAADLEPDIRAWLAKKSHGTAYKVLFREHGELQMAPAPAVPGREQTGYRIGIPGGRVKPSSGYAFLRIQRQSRVLAQALIAGRPLPQRIEPAHYPLLDAVFLRALSQSPASAPDYFMKLFENTPADVLVRFLSESGSLAESLRTALSLPRLPFLKSALATAGAR